MSLLSRLLPRSPKTQQPARRSQPRLGVHQLEDRTTPTASFDSAFGISGITPSDVAVDTAGHSYVVGTFRGTVDFEPSDPADAADTRTARGTGGYGDAYVAKYAADNSLVWVRQMGGDGIDTGSELKVDGAGNVFVTGLFSGVAEFGTQVRTSAGGYDAFVTKLNSAGDFQWTSKWGGVNDDSGRGVGFDAAGNVYGVSQRYAGTSVSSNNGYDIVKFNADGGAVWSKWVNTRYYLPSAGFGVDAAGNTFLGGNFIGAVDFDPGKKTVTRSSYGPGTSWCGGFVLKLTSAGAYSWVTTMDSGHAFVRDLELSGSNAIVSSYVGGASSEGVTKLRPASGSVISMPTGTSVITKLNGSGQHVWSAPLAGVTASDIAVDAAGSIYATGSLYGTADFDPGAGVRSHTTAGTSDTFALKLTSAGTFGWVETFGGDAIDQGTGIAVAADGTVTLIGFFTSASIDFDPDPNNVFNLVSPGTSTSFLVKLRQS